MLILDGIFKNNIFVPDHGVSVLDGTRGTVSIEEAGQKAEPETMQQKKAWHDFFEGIKSLDEDLPAEFDAIIEKGMLFGQADFS
jgi:hypothetical protein